MMDVELQDRTSRIRYVPPWDAYSDEAHAFLEARRVRFIIEQVPITDLRLRAKLICWADGAEPITEEISVNATECAIYEWTNALVAEMAKAQDRFCRQYLSLHGIEVGDA